jgi:gas vesicle structural protein
MQQRGAGGSYVQRSSSSGLYEIIDLILDKGLVIDVFARVSLVGIEILTIDARIVIASVDTYLRFAEAVNRLDLTESGGTTLPELAQDLTQDGSKSKTKGALEGAKETVFGSEESDEESRQPAQARRSSGSGQAKRRASSRRRDDDQ